MALSTILKKICPVCGKVAIEKSSYELFGTTHVTLECGHLLAATQLSTNVDIETCLNGIKLRPFQIEGVKRLQKASARAILADEQGLGKTIQILALLKLHPEELMPAVIVVPSSVRGQWHHEIREKCGVKGFLTQAIMSGKEMAAPGFDISITTYDLLKNENAFDIVKDKIKFLVLDECQRIKNHDTGRA